MTKSFRVETTARASNTDRLGNNAALESILERLEPGELVHVNYDVPGERHHAMVAIKTTLDGFHSGRARFFVGCTSVDCNTLMHEATTGPLSRMEDHVLRFARTEAQ